MRPEYAFFDSHCHVHGHRFDEDRAEALARAREAGVGRILTLGDDFANIGRFCTPEHLDYTAADVVRHLLG